MCPGWRSGDGRSNRGRGRVCFVAIEAAAVVAVVIFAGVAALINGLGAVASRSLHDKNSNGKSTRTRFAAGVNAVPVVVVAVVVALFKLQMADAVR